VIHLSVGDTPPAFHKDQWVDLAPELGGPNAALESVERITDVWSLPTSSGKNGHGAEFPLALPGRCIALASAAGDLVLDPFLGSGTTALAAMRLGRRCLGFDISEEYVALARSRVAAQRKLAELSASEAAMLEAQLDLEIAGPDKPANAAVSPPVPGSTSGQLAGTRPPRELVPAAPSML
jgi:hypothetical protein